MSWVYKYTECEIKSVGRVRNQHAQWHSPHSFQSDFALSKLIYCIWLCWWLNDKNFATEGIRHRKCDKKRDVVWIYKFGPVALFTCFPTFFLRSLVPNPCWKCGSNHIATLTRCHCVYTCKFRVIFLVLNMIIICFFPILVY